ncbi:MAG: pyruvate formate lyase-activating protein [Deltaproteobacteria bacterium]|nr:pyruvate formate lyase-activating protein [Deltaproteobacteria bacterium]
MSDGALLALDVGGGTQDLFLWEPGQPVENAVKMVLPAPTQVLARRIGRLTSQRLPLFLNGRVMGGGAVSSAVRRHLAQRLPVFATAEAARTLHDNLETVKQWGLTLTDAPPADAVTITLGDVDLEGLGVLLAAFEVPLPSRFAVAVQDHGFNPLASNRRFRFQHWENFLAGGGRLADLAYRRPPAAFTRMLAVAEALPGALLMDTCAAGVRGALLDEAARARRGEGLTVVNLGNAHTFAALVQGDRLLGIYEHHTGLLTPVKLADHLRRFQVGTLTNEEIFADEGHGCAISSDYRPGPSFAFTVITGPRRRLARDWPEGVFAAPLGDMMLSGCFGLAAAYAEAEGLPWRPGDS